MIDGFLFVLTLLSALGCGLNAGVLFAFSSFVMPALKRLPPAQGIAAMQSINILAVTPPFMMTLFGTAAACLVLIVWAVLSLGEQSAALVLAGGILYLVGTIGVTAARNVPLNNRLAALNPESAEAMDRWNEYVRKWTAWNHLRVVASLAAAAVLTIALRV
ncbi:anthrone oxygenase family protein [Rubrobacter aplysinae]|uniref:anthrone oxygenase family protein n=1 Tax=Rubrobacter aplysinae TaxID=909625 RepID=UPI00064C291C|nr:anthrone oxygenase family protein [Rubrobacter aplysinae]